MRIHPTAVVNKKAEVDREAVIGPYCIIGEGVRISKGVEIQGHVIIEGDTEIGPGSSIYPFASIGLPPQDLKYAGEKTGVRIGAKNIIREYVTIHRASVGGEGFTRLGDGNFLMAYSHIAHDCTVGSHVVIVNAATLGGHVQVGDNAIIGGLVAVHQFTRIGAFSMVGGFSGIGQDIPPYTTASGPRAKLFGLNMVGLKRHGFSKQTINELNQAYKILFRSRHTVKEAIKKIQEELPATPEIKLFVDFVRESRRGICRPSSKTTIE
jgi:UDP-N-acetylglucosamine acyltransferase